MDTLRERGYLAKEDESKYKHSYDEEKVSKDYINSTDNNFVESVTESNNDKNVISEPIDYNSVSQRETVANDNFTQNMENNTVTDDNFTQDTENNTVTDDNFTQNTEKNVKSESNGFNSTNIPLDATAMRIKSLSNEAVKVFEREYEKTGGNIDKAEFLKQFNRFYIGALTGKDYAVLDKKYGDMISESAKKSAYKAGKKDRAADLKRQKGTVQNTAVKKGGMIRNNNSDRINANIVKAADDVAKALGVTVSFEDEVINSEERSVNGQYSNGHIRISMKAVEGSKSFGVDTAIQFVIGHEFSHRVQELAPESYSKFRDVAYEMYEKRSGNIDGTSEAERVSAQRGGMNINASIDEVVADLVGTEGFAKRIARADLSLAEKIRNWFYDVLDAVGIRTYSEVERLFRTWDKAVNEAKKVVKESGVSEGVGYGDVKYSKGSIDDILHETGKIKEEDVYALRSIGRKSINDFTSDDIDKSKKWANKFYKELGVKSPFFRAWFGDWRAYDKTNVHIVTEKGSARGVVKNNDTGWDINVSGKVFNETNKHMSKKALNAVSYMDCINSIVKNAVLLDTNTISSNKVKSGNSAFMHSLYAVADTGNGKELLKLFVEELNDVNSDGTIKRAYQLQNINKIPLTGTEFSQNDLSLLKQRNNYTVSDLFDFVKTYDENFDPKDVNSAMLNEDGTPKLFYHGTSRGDRVGNVFRGDRATSGPMAFFTDSKEIANNYARDKKDTSIAYDEEYDDYYKQFRINKNGRSISVGELWNTLSMAEKARIKEAATHITFDDEGEIVYDKNVKYGLGNMDSYTINMNKGNVINALITSWLEDGNLYGEEGRFLEVLDKVGITDVEYRNPDARDEKVYEVYLNIKNPFNTENVDEEFADDLYEYSKEYESEDSNNADMWDKRNVTPELFNERLTDDIERGSTNAWTSIPDFVTEYLKNEGYDGIIDKGGKNGGAGHTVCIPFESNQIKSATDNVGTFDSGNDDIRYSEGSIDDIVGMTEEDYLKKNGIPTNKQKYNEKIINNYKKDVENWFSKGKIPARGYFDLGKPTEIVNKKINNNNSIIMFDSVMVKATGGKHQISVEEMSKLAEKIQDPLMIFKSDTVKNAFVFFVEMMNKQNVPVIVAIHLNKSYNRGRVTNIASVHSRMDTETYKDHTQQFIDSQVKKGNFIHANKKSQSWFTTVGLQLPSVVQTYIDYNYNIAQNDVDVNTQNKNFSEKNSEGSIDDILRNAQKDLEFLNNEYGSFEQGENPARDVKVPKQNNKQSHNMRYSRTAAEAPQLNDEMAANILKAVGEGAFSYKRVKDESAWGNAQTYVKMYGVDGGMQKWNSIINSGKAVNKNDIALGEYLLEVAAKKGDLKTVVKMTTELAAEGTRAGQTIQALRLLKKMDGSAQLMYIEKVVNDMQNDLIKRFGKKAPKIEISDSLKENLVSAVDPDDINSAVDDILTSVAKQMPSTWVDKWNAWRYLAMLGNPRTHIRNLVGNAVFIPAVAIKNTIGATVEGTVDTVSRVTRKKGIERTKTLKPASMKYIKFANSDFAKVEDILSGGGKMNPTDIISEKRRIFKFKPLESVQRINSNLLECEDRIFLKYHYINSLASYLEANKVDIDTLYVGNINGYKLLEKARSYAINEAQKATYRDANSFASAINRFAKSSAIAQLGTDALLPFKKTPANILKRGIEYSPAGLLDIITRQSVKLAKGKITSNEYIDRLASGLTGLGITALGYWLASMGIIRGAKRDKDEEFEELQGAQSYALYFGNEKEKSYTIDWAAPVCLPLFVGVEVYRLTEREGGMDVSAVMDSLSTLSDPIFELSMLDGLNNVLESPSKNPDDKASVAILRETINSYLGQGVPTLLGQITRTFADDTRRRTYADKNSSVPTWAQYMLQRQANKIPELSKKQEPYIDEWGRMEKTDNIWERAFENFISPGYYSEIDSSYMENELMRLAREKVEGVYPKLMPKYFNVDKERKDLTAKEYTEFQTVVGKKSYELLTDIINSDAYSDLNDEQRGEAISKIYEVTKVIGKKSISDYESDTKWIEEAIQKGDEAIVAAAIFKSIADEYTSIDGFYKIMEKGFDTAGYVEFSEKTRGLTADKDKNGKTITGSKQKKIIDILNNMDITDEEKAYYYSTQYENQKNNPWKKYLD